MKIWLKTWVMLLGLLLLSPSACLAAEEDYPVVGAIHDFTQTDERADFVVIRGDKTLKSPPPGTQLRENDRIVTSKSGMVTIALQDDSYIVIGPASQLLINKVMSSDGKGGSALSLAFGFIRAVVNKVYPVTGKFMVATPNSVMGVRGTQFVVESLSPRKGELRTTRLSTLDGLVEVTGVGASSTTEVDVEGNFTTALTGEGKPATPVKFTKAELQARLEKLAPGLAQQFLEKDVRIKGGGAKKVDFEIKKDE